MAKEQRIRAPRWCAAKNRICSALPPGRRPVLILLVFVGAIASSGPCAEAYENYTVGESTGWFDGSMAPGLDYQKWADDKNFTLGDFLIFRTDRNHSVIQTYNAAAFKNCDYNAGAAADTIEWSVASPEFSQEAVTVSVPLLKEGKTYFFSGNYDGEQCQSGQRFMIMVAHRQGLPNSLKPSQEAAAGPASPDDGAGLPDTATGSSWNFNHPSNDTDTDTDAQVKPQSGSGEVTSVAAGLGLALLMLTILVL